MSRKKAQLLNPICPSTAAAFLVIIIITLIQLKCIDLFLYVIEENVRGENVSYMYIYWYKKYKPDF